MINLDSIMKPLKKKNGLNYAIDLLMQYVFFTKAEIIYSKCVFNRITATLLVSRVIVKI